MYASKFRTNSHWFENITEPIKSYIILIFFLLFLLTPITSLVGVSRHIVCRIVIVSYKTSGVGALSSCETNASIMRQFTLLVFMSRFILSFAGTWMQKRFFYFNRVTNCKQIWIKFYIVRIFFLISHYSFRNKQRQIYFPTPFKTICTFC